MLETVLPTEHDASDAKVCLDTLNGNIAQHQNGSNYELPPDECWLFKFPNTKANSSSHHHVIQPIHLWVREVFDSPNSCFYSSRYNLLNRLETILLSGGPISAYRFGGSVPSLNLSTSGSICNVPTGKHFPFDANSISTGLDNNFVGSNPSVVGWPKTNSSDGLQHAVNSMGTIIQNQRPDTSPGSSFNRVGGSFVRVGLPKYSLPPQYSASHQRRLSNVSSNSTSHLGHPVGQGFTGSISTTGSFDELQLGASGKANVQEIARIQEDNLKAEVAALVAAAGRRGSQHSLSSLGRRSPDGGGGGFSDVICRGSSISNNLGAYQATNGTVGSNSDYTSLDIHQTSVFPTDACDDRQHFPNSANPMPCAVGIQQYNPVPQNQSFVSSGSQVAATQSGRRMHVTPLVGSADNSTKPPLVPNFPTTHSGIPVSAEQRNQFGFRSIRRPTAPSVVRTQLPGSAVQGACSRISSDQTQNSTVLSAKHYDWCDN